MSISRSKSALLVSSSAALPGSSHIYPARPLPLRRTRSAGAHHTPLHVTSPYSPRTEREDPFNLTSFFPSQLCFAEGSQEQQWKWLQDCDGDSDSECAEHSRVSSPIAEEFLPPTPPDTSLIGAADEATADIIKHEDKLGILALGEFMPSGAANDPSLGEQLLSPYAEDGPTDDDGLYYVLCGLRKRQASLLHKREKPLVTFDQLFAPRTDGDVELLDGDRGSLVYRGMWRALEFFDGQL
ncbi:uncharacterized protein LAESUDRAFT_759773 [Laetiporus sulphureus 93-53]|uniref:Uncharacterized protein n=1 Tax=Laetiporus sulphureus 93-53 TaxID=1314785 RepID=A0A165DYE9_9APHY|nr:uncharacterized protein LAESUDRAFT_759773 [Laetiporus sulphureus 93-53]KZT05873.1 hypothetical protein LAESUDRAFT_759773 [Laetiporus sulphureus 93-53]